jgi:lipopolysaccharide/colanic/teichoic acid biosynthesis glycosyltransferase
MKSTRWFARYRVCVAVMLDKTGNLPDVVKVNSGIPHPVEVALAIIGLLISAPVIVLSALAIAFTSRGPVVFRQQRVGRDGRLFSLYKLRTMRQSNRGPGVTARGDERVTTVGKLLRKTKLDELPELWNVITGDISLVGPRPEVPQYVDLEDPRWRTVLAARPGLTDPTTLRLRNEEVLLAGAGGDPEEFYLRVLQPYKLQGYLDYLNQRGCWKDVKVLWKTVVAIILPTRAALPTNDEVLNRVRGEDLAS